jgi:Holliday junction resolvase RusA-like endonuclease
MAHHRGERGVSLTPKKIRTLEHLPSTSGARQVEPHPLERVEDHGQAITFFVPGMPAPGGSKRAFRGPGGRILVTEDCRRSRPWRAVVQVTAHAAHAAPPLEGPLRLTVTFTLPRPRAHYGRRGLRPSAPPYPTTRPDLTKLLRALEDACTGLLWRDDSAIVEQVVGKRYGDVPGAAVRVEMLIPAEDHAV